MYIRCARAVRHVVVPAKPFVRRLFTRYLLPFNVGVSMATSGMGDVIAQSYKGTRERYNAVRTLNMTVAGSVSGLLYHYWYLALDSRLVGHTGRVIAKKVVLDQLIASPVVILAFSLSLEACRRLTRPLSLAISSAEDSVSSSQSLASSSQSFGCSEVDSEKVCASQAGQYSGVDNELSFGVNFSEGAPEKVASTFLKQGIECSAVDEVPNDTLFRYAMLYPLELAIFSPAQAINFYFLPTRYRVLYDNCVSLIYDVFVSSVIHDADFEPMKHKLNISTSDTHKHDNPLV